MSAPVTARHLNMASCPICALVNRLPEGRRSGTCSRCGALITQRKRQSAERTWAFLVAALVLYFPANLMPIMHAHSVVNARDDTIWSGIQYLWHGTAWPLAIIVFVASLAIPLFKLVALSGLLLTIRLQSRAGLVLRTRLFRIVEVTGPWSMLDVYVVALLTSLVQMGAIAEVTPGPGAFAFAAVVVLTMLAARSFDPRLMWDQLDANPRAQARPSYPAGYKTAHD
jgi:paraquat-inducible protein A